MVAKQAIPKEKQPGKTERKTGGKFTFKPFDDAAGVSPDGQGYDEIQPAGWCI